MDRVNSGKWGGPLRHINGLDRIDLLMTCLVAHYFFKLFDTLVYSLQLVKFIINALYIATIIIHNFLV